MNTSGTASFYLEFTTTKAQLGEFGAHFGQIVLPLELLSFTGNVLAVSNRLEWVTASEKNVRAHILERSADGLNWAEIGRIPGLAMSNQPVSYRFEDKKPLPRAYYRLRSVDFDQRQQVSGALILTREMAGLQWLQVYPVPTHDQLTVSFYAPSENEFTFRIYDLNGRAILEQRQTGYEGMNTKFLDVRSLPAGMYLLILSDGVSQSAPYRIVRP